MNILFFSQSGAARYANEQFAAFANRVLSDGGIIQRPDYVYQMYKLLYELGYSAGGGAPLQIRRMYDALAGVKLNNVSGTDYVQTMYDFGNTSDARVNAVQTTAANQPLWATHATLPAGIRAPQFDGSNDIMTIADLGIYNGQAAGTLTVIANDFARTGGDADHAAIFISRGDLATSTRSALFTRGGGSANSFTAAGRRLDADSLRNSSNSASADGLNRLTGLFVWGGNTLQLITNGTAQTATTFSSGAGPTQTNDSLAFTLGAVNATTARLNGIIPHAMAARIVLTSDQNAKIRELQKSFYTSLP